MNCSALDPETGKWADVVCRRHPSEGWSIVYLGDRQIGYAIHHPGDYSGPWTAISTVSHPKGFRSVRGFARRRNVIEYLLFAGRIWDDNRSETRLMTMQTLSDLNYSFS